MLTQLRMGASAVFAARVACRSLRGSHTRGLLSSPGLLADETYGVDPRPKYR
jgi:hypothetical protein